MKTMTILKADRTICNSGSIIATTQCGKANEIEIEIYSNAGLGVAGICGTAAVVGAGIVALFKKKRR